MTRAERFDEALEIIAPDPSHWAECKRDLAVALTLVDREARIEKSELTPAENRNLLQALARSLQKAIRLATQATVESSRPWNARIDDLKRCLKEAEDAADYISKTEDMKKAPRLSAARVAAVWEAYTLLEKYGPPPTLYRDGNWHKLAKVLLGDKQADLVEYMQMRLKLNQDLVG